MSKLSIPVYKDTFGRYDVSADDKFMFYVSEKRIAIIATEDFQELYTFPTKKFETKKIYERDDGSIIFTCGNIKYCYDTITNKLIFDNNPLTFCYEEYEIVREYDNIFSTNTDEHQVDEKDQVDVMYQASNTFQIMNLDKIIYTQNDVYDFVQFNDTCVYTVAKIRKCIYLQKITCDPNTNECKVEECMLLGTDQLKSGAVRMPKLYINKKEEIAAVAYNILNLLSVDLHTLQIIGLFENVSCTDGSHLVVNERHSFVKIIHIKSQNVVKVLQSTYWWSTIQISGNFMITQALDRNMLFANITDQNEPLLEYNLNHSGKYAFQQIASINNGSSIILFGVNIDKISTAFLKHKEQKHALLMGENDKHIAPGRFMNDGIFDRHLLGEIFQFLPTKMKGYENSGK